MEPAEPILYLKRPEELLMPTVQGVKIKPCKTALNRVYRHLAHLDSDPFAAFPFITTHDGIYVADVGFIPEKYRLDVKRMEKILSQCLAEWLITVQGGQAVRQTDSMNAL